MGKTRDAANLVSDGNLSVNIANDRIGIGTTTPVSQLHVRTGPVVIGSATSTGTASQTLQVTGGTYVSGNLGIGTTNPTSALQVVGVVSATSAVVGSAVTLNSTGISVVGVVSATSYRGDGSQLTNLSIPQSFNELDAALFN